MVETPQHRVLVIDDDPLFLHAFASALRRQFTVELSKDGEDGFLRAVMEPPDAIVVDYHMPGWTGERTIKAIREHVKTSTIPVLMVTGDDRESTLTQATDAGATACLSKADITLKAITQNVALLIGLDLPGTN